MALNEVILQEHRQKHFQYESGKVHCQQQQPAPPVYFLFAPIDEEGQSPIHLQFLR